MVIITRLNSWSRYWVVLIKALSWRPKLKLLSAKVVYTERNVSMDEGYREFYAKKEKDKSRIVIHQLLC